MTTGNLPPQKKKYAFDSLEQQLYLNLWRTYDCLKAVEEQLFSQYQLTAQQYNLLRILKEVYPATLPTLTLGRRLISRAPDITRILNRLEARQLIERQRQAANRRIVQVSLTAAGRQLLTEMAAEVTQMHQQQLGHLSSETQQQLLQLLKTARAPLEDGTCGWLND